MKFALCFSGFVRGYRDNLSNIRENLIEPIQKDGHQIDIYLSTWKKCDKDSYQEWDENPEKEAKKYFKAKKWEIEDLPKHSNRWFLMFKKTKQSIDLAKNNDEYDFYIRTRTDLKIRNKINIEQIKCLEDKILFPDFDMPKGWRGTRIQDWFAIGNKKAIENYCLPATTLEDKAWGHPENQLLKCLESKNQKWEWAEGWKIVPWKKW